MGPAGVRAPPLPSRPLPRVARPTEERALSLPGNPCPGQLGRLTGGKVWTVPPENSLGELPYCAPGFPPGWPWRGAGSVLSLRHPYPRMVSLAANGKSIPPPPSALYTHFVGSLLDGRTPGPFDQRLLSVGSSPCLTPPLPNPSERPEQPLL